ncbi:GntR family transcriptional regulator [Microbacterium sp.]|uniref:GntR family transcriptional regulator n=1 Tax=Microbacterium sp. TaxID=51671 RepID=UPI0039E53DF9
MAGVLETELESVRVAGILRDDIVRGRRLPGSRLIERDIATELNVSRLPVREAIKTLVSEGVVVARPRSWAVVRQFTPRDVRELGEVRQAIETQIFEFAAQRHDETGLARLQAVLDEEIDAARAGDPERARLAAGRFHEIAGHLADNAMLTELISVFATRLRWLFGQHDDLVAMAEDHRRILEALRARDVEEIRRLIPEHLAKGQDEAERRLGSEYAV